LASHNHEFLSPGTAVARKCRSGLNGILNPPPHQLIFDAAIARGYCCLPIIHSYRSGFFQIRDHARLSPLAKS